MCPLVRELERRGNMESLVCLTSQHRELLYAVTGLFGVEADFDLGLMRERQSLGAVFSGVLLGMGRVLEEVSPALVLVHGDTSTSCAAALAAFYRQIPVGHVEAGLRSYARYSPFPEEMNRRMTAALATLHFAPTERNAQNLCAEGIRDNVFVTGNTVIDALRLTVRPDYVFSDAALRAAVPSAGRCVLLTSHRRENIPRGLAAICRAAARLLSRYAFCFPCSPQPRRARDRVPAARRDSKYYVNRPALPHGHA